MPVFECPIFLHPDNFEPLINSINSRSYTVKSADKLFDPETKDQDIEKYMISIKVPSGISHYYNLVKAFERVNATRAEDDWGTPISESWKEKLGDFLREKGLEAIGIYVGSFGLILALIFHLNLFFPTNHNGELEHLILKTTFLDWIFFGIEALIPSFLYLITSWGSYKRRFGE